MANKSLEVVSPEVAALMAQLAQLQASNDLLKAQVETVKAAAAKKVYFKVSEKGALSLYGMGRFPVTLYKGQWETVLQLVEDGSMKTALALPGLKNKEDETVEEAAARRARIEAYTATTKAAVAAVNAAKNPSDDTKSAVAPIVRKAQ
jgi:hypothetical protein